MTSVKTRRARRVVERVVACGALVLLGVPGCYLSHERAGVTSGVDGGPPVEAGCPVSTHGEWAVDSIWAGPVGGFSAAADPVCGLHVVVAEPGAGGTAPFPPIHYLRDHASGFSEEPWAELYGFVRPRSLVVGRGGLVQLLHLAVGGLRLAERGLSTDEFVDPAGLGGALVGGVDPFIVYVASMGDRSVLRYAQRSMTGFAVTPLDDRQAFEPSVALRPGGSLVVSWEWLTSPSTHGIAVGTLARPTPTFTSDDLEREDPVETDGSSAIVVSGTTTHVFYGAYRPGGGMGLRHAFGDGAGRRFEWLDDFAFGGLVTGAAAVDRAGEVHVVYAAASGELHWAHGDTGAWTIEPLPGSGSAAIVVPDAAGTLYVVAMRDGRLVSLRRTP